MIDKNICNKGFIWILSNCECKCDKLCDVGKYLDYANCKYRKRLSDTLIEECSENIDGKELHSNEMIYNGTLNDYEQIFNCCSVYIVLLVIFFIISISIRSVFIYFHWYLNKSKTGVTNTNPNTDAVIY